MDYKALRNQFLPKKCKAVFIAESPPSGGGYFYNPAGRVSEVLFRAMMKTVCGTTPGTKADGLQTFADQGYLLVDPIYTPVDKLPDKEADKLILQHYPEFIADLEKTVGKTVPLILIKANICRLLETRLRDDGFTVLNNGVQIPFPLHYHLPSFSEKVTKLLTSL